MLTILLVKAIYTAFLTAGLYLGGLIGGYVTVREGYRYIFWISTAICGVTFLVCFFLVPETLFVRELGTISESRHIQERDLANTEDKPDWTQMEDAQTDNEYTFIQSLKIGVYRGGLLNEFLAPWLTLRLPGVWVVTLHYSGLLGGIVTISTIGPQLLAAPPYLWGQNSGLINVAGIIGNVIGACVVYMIADKILQRTAGRESHGYAEPEARLPGLFPALFLATAGLWTFDFCGEYPSSSAWVGMCVGLGMLSYGLAQIPSIGFNYVSRYNFMTIGKSILSFRLPSLLKLTVDASDNRSLWTSQQRLLRHHRNFTRYRLIHVDILY